MVHMRAEFVVSVARHGRNFQTFKQCLRVTLCVYNVEENIESHRMWNVVCNPFLKPAEIQQLCDMCGEHTMSSSMVQRPVQCYNKCLNNGGNYVEK